MINPLSSLIGKPFINTIVLFRTPKCASSSLYSAIGPRNLFWRERKFLEQKLSADKKYNGLFDPSHVLPSESYRLFGREILNYFSVCCVRNPFDRAVSSFSFSRGKGWGKLYSLPDDGSFSEFCEAIYKLRKDSSFWPATTQSIYSHGCVPIKYVLRFENLQSSWSKMIQENEIRGLPEALPHENSSSHMTWQEYYGETEKAIIQEVFAEDFKNHRYSTSF